LTPDCSKPLVTARMPSPRKVSPSPSRSASTSFLNERSMVASAVIERREVIAWQGFRPSVLYAVGPGCCYKRRFDLSSTEKPRSISADGLDSAGFCRFDCRKETRGELPQI